MKGKIYLVGAGPGDPDLLTLKALRLLRTADAVLYDDLVAPEILALIPSSTQRQNVGKRCGTKKIQQEEINFLMIAMADAGLQVVRLKSGDPLIFGRAGEEMNAFRRAGISYEIVPGITSALGAAAAAQIPLTYRRKSSAVVLLTGQQAAESEAADWSKLVASGATLVIYMPGSNYLNLAAKLKSAGLPTEIPCAMISRATTPQQRIHRCTIEELRHAPHLNAPTILVIGEIVRLRDTALDELVAHSSSSDVFMADIVFPKFLNRSTVDEESFA